MLRIEKVGEHAGYCRARTCSAVTPAIATRFWRLRSPLTIRMSRLGTCRAAAKKATRASLAAPSTGGAATRTSSAPSRVPAHAVLPARGMTRTSISTPAPVSRIRKRLGRAALSAHRSCRSSSTAEPRAVEQDLVLALARFLLADELERVPQRRNRRLERRLDVLALQLEAVDLALDVFEPRLGLLEQQVGARLRRRGRSAAPRSSAVAVMSSASLCAVISVLCRFFSCSLVLGQRRPRIRDEVLPQPVGFAQRLLVVVGHGGQERGDFDRVETAECPAEFLLPEVERADIHADLFSVHGYRPEGVGTTEVQRMSLAPARYG